MKEENRNFKEKKQNKIILFFLLLIVVFSLTLVSSPPVVVSGEDGGGNTGGAGDGVDGDSGSSCSLSAWAWSGYTDSFDKLGGIGWTSFTNSNQNDAVEYGVTIEEGTGLMTGYIWSPAIGWIKFGELSGFPTGSGTTASNATLGSDDKVTGWIRACSVFTNGCSGTIKPASQLGGWDGWIALSGTNWGVTYDSNNNKFDGFGWGGPKVVGWFDFVDVGWNQNNCDNGDSGFQYSVLIDSLELQTPSSGSISNDVDISKVKGNSQEVSIVEVVQQGSPILGVDLDFSWPSSGCTPNDDCTLSFDVDYTLTGKKTLIVPVLVVTESGGEERDNSFNIAISGGDGNLVCFAAPSSVFRNQPMEWRAVPRNLPGVDKYVWSDSVSKIDGQEGQNIPVPDGYALEGTINAGVEALDIDGTTLAEGECSLQVLPEIYFEHI